jgi:hypothetical protein
VQDGSELVNESGQTLQDIVASVKKVTDIIGEIAAASQEQSSGIDQVNKAVAQMDQVVQSNAAQTEELSSTAQALTTQAEHLQGLVAQFKLGQASAMIARQTAVTSERALPAKPRLKETDATAAPRRAAESRLPTPKANGHDQQGFEEF